jgi:hypothetical protein
MRMVCTLVFPLGLQSVLQLHAISDSVICIVAKLNITPTPSFSFP